MREIYGYLQLDFCYSGNCRQYYTYLLALDNMVVVERITCGHRDGYWYENTIAKNTYKTMEEALKNIPLNWIFGRGGIFYDLTEEEKEIVLKRGKKVSTEEFHEIIGMTKTEDINTYRLLDRSDKWIATYRVNYDGEIEYDLFVIE